MRGISDDTMETIRFAPKAIGTGLGCLATLAAGLAAAWLLLVGGFWLIGWVAEVVDTTDHAAEARYQEAVRQAEDCHTYSDIRGGLYERIEGYRHGDGRFDPADAPAIAEFYLTIEEYRQRSRAEGCP